MSYTDKPLLRKRALIESINDHLTITLRTSAQIAHTRYRSPYNSLVHLLAGLAAYRHQPKKPSLRQDREEPVTLRRFS